MIITKETNGVQETYIQAFDIEYINHLKIPLPMSIYLKWVLTKKNEYNFIKIDKTEEKFIKRVYNVLFDFDTYPLKFNNYSVQIINNKDKENYREKYYLKNIRYILNDADIKNSTSKEKEKKIKV